MKCIFIRKCIWEKVSLVFAKQIICDFVLSCIVIKEFNLFLHVENLHVLDEIWKLVNLVSYVSQQRGSPWSDAFGIFHNNSCLLELLFFFFFFSLLKTTKICFGFTKMGIFYREKAFHAGKKQEKWLCPLRKICLLRPWWLLQQQTYVFEAQLLQQHMHHKLIPTWKGNIWATLINEYFHLNRRST